MFQGRARIFVAAAVCLVAALCQSQSASADWIEELIEGRTYAPRVGVHHETESYGFDTPFTDFRAFVPISVFDNELDLLAMDSRLLIDNQGELGFNIGAVYRSYISNLDAVFGMNVYVDQRQTNFFRFNQVGFGWELLGSRFEARQNFYVPSGQDRKLIGTSINPGGLIGFQDNFLMVGRDFFYEQALRGFDFEIGGAIPGTDVWEGARPLRAYIGNYFYNNPGSEDVKGISSRVNFQQNQLLDLNLFVTHDNLYKTHVGFGATLFFDALGASGENPAVDRGLYDRMMDVVQRRQNITVDTVEQINVAEPLLDADTGNPFRFVHVDNLGAGDGTFESPLDDLAQVFANSQTGDIIYIHGNTTFDAQGSLVLQDGQRVWGEGVLHELNSIQLGVIALPAVNGGPVPVISNSLADTIVLANDNEISGLAINTPVGNAIFGDNVNNLNINRVDIDGAGLAGLTINNFSGQLDLLDNTILGSNLNNVLINGSTADFDIRLNDFSNSITGSGFEANLTGAVTGSLDQNVSSGNEIDGFIVTAPSMTGSIFDNTANDNGNNGFTVGIGDFTGNFDSNEANNNDLYGVDWSGDNFALNMNSNTTNGNGNTGLRMQLTGEFFGNFTFNTANDNHNSTDFTFGAGFDIAFDRFDGNFTDNTANNNGDALLQQTYGMNIVGNSFFGDFTDNNANDNGGGIIALDAGIFMDLASFEGDFSNNNSNGNFGTGSSLTISTVLNESTFIGNTSSDNSGSGFLTTIDSFNGFFDNNIANGNLYNGVNWNGTTFVGTFTGNQTNGSTGFPAANSSGVVMNLDEFNGNFDGNTSNNNVAGALGVASGYELNIDSFSGSLLGNNANGNSGYGIDWNGVTFNGQVGSNIANGNVLSGISMNGTTFTGAINNNQTNGSTGLLGFNSSGMHLTFGSLSGVIDNNTSSNNVAGFLGTASGFDFDVDAFDADFFLNRAENNDTNGLVIDGTTLAGTISNNQLNDNEGDGMQLNADTFTTGVEISGNTTNGNDGNGIQITGTSFDGIFDGNTANGNGSSSGLTNNSGIFITLDSFTGEFTNNTANDNFNTGGLSAAHGFDLNITDFGSLANPVIFTGNTANNNNASGALSASNGFDLAGTNFVGLIDDNTAIGNTNGNGMVIDYNTLTARITNNEFNGNGNSGNEAGLFINSNDATTSTVLIEDNIFGITGQANRVGLNVDVATGSTLNIHVLDNEVVSTQTQSIRINASGNFFGADGNVNLNLFDNNVSNRYDLLEGSFGATFDLGFVGAPAANETAQVTANNNTTNNGVPTVNASAGIDFIMSNTIPLPPVFP